MEFIEICGKEYYTHKTVRKVIIRIEQIKKITNGHLKYPVIWWKNDEFNDGRMHNKHFYLSQTEYERLKKILCKEA